VYTPLLSVVAVNTFLSFASSVNVTTASGTAPPYVSITVPVTDARAGGLMMARESTVITGTADRECFKFTSDFLGLRRNIRVFPISGLRGMIPGLFGQLLRIRRCP